jgi:hypothetical protein
MVLAGLLFLEQVDTQTPLVTSRFHGNGLGLMVFRRLPQVLPGVLRHRAGPNQWCLVLATHQSDAIILATLLGMPAINGNSSIWPRGWALQDPAGIWLYRRDAPADFSEQS